MVRWTVIMRWKPEKYPEILKRFVEQLKGEPPEVMEADKRIKEITWEFGSVFGQCINIWVGEGEPADFSTVLRHYIDLMEIEIVPTLGFDTVKKFFPEKHPSYE